HRLHGALPHDRARGRRADGVPRRPHPFRLSRAGSGVREPKLRPAHHARALTTEARMGVLDGKGAIVTGAARGIGRGEALELASHGAKVLVNDLGGEWDGTGADSRPAQLVVDEIVSAGGVGAANYDDVADWSGAKKMIDEA